MNEKNNSKESKNLENNEKEKSIISQNFLNNELLLLLIIIFIFFKNTDVFSKQFQFLQENLKTIKNYLNTADAALQALDQASKIPSQMLN